MSAWSPLPGSTGGPPPSGGEGAEAGKLAVWPLAPRGSTSMSTEALDPFASAPRLQVTTPALWEQEPCVGVAETKNTVAGSWIVSVTPLAGSGPTRFLAEAV